MILAVYKPKGPSSNRVLTEIKKITGIKKIGHAGTLDPLAEGILVIGLGRESTKKLNVEVKKEKEYIAEIKLGVESETDDEEGEKIIHQVNKEPDIRIIKKIIKKYIGEIEQIPPFYSAIKINGQEAYKRIRRGEKIIMKPRKIIIKDIKILKYKWPILKIKVVTGPGAYIRSLARDIGNQLKVSGYLFSLIRTRVGEYKIDRAIKINEINNIIKK